jgi:hypothetical protein
MFLYFYPSLNNLKIKNKNFKKNSFVLSQYKSELKKFKKPTEEEKLLWKKIEEKINSKKIILKSEKAYLSLLSKYIKILKIILAKDYDDFLLNLDDKNIKITQTLKDNSDLKEYFKNIKNLSSVKSHSQETTSFVAYQQNMGNYKKKEKKSVIINLFFISNIEKTSNLLYKLTKEFPNLNIDKITIMRKDKKTFYLIALKLNIKKVYNNVKK